MTEARSLAAIARAACGIGAALIWARGLRGSRPLFTTGAAAKAAATAGRSARLHDPV